MKYGVLDNKGFLLLTGDVGTGKTTMINALLASLGEDTIVATVPDPDLEKLDFYNFIANEFNIKSEFTSKGAFLIHFKKFLQDAYSKNRKVLLIIDEAQRLNSELLEEIRLLSNIERQNTKSLNIFFIGQNEFNDTLLKTENRALRQRITLNCNINPLTEKETREYIQYRLKVAGQEKKIFSPEAIREIFSFTKGYPRLINITCELALLTGYVKDAKTIRSDIIRECAEELRIQCRTGEKDKVKQKSAPETKEKITEETQPVAESEIRQEAAVKTASQPLKRRVGYIGLFVFLLIVIGYFYFQGGTWQFFAPSQRMTSTSPKSATIEYIPMEDDNSKPSSPDRIEPVNAKRLEKPNLEAKKLFGEQKIKLASVVACKGVRNRQYLDETNVFHISETAHPYIWMEVKSEKQPFVLKHVYYFNGEKYCDVPLKIRYPRMRTWSYVTLKNPDHIGRWQVKVTGEDGEVLKQISFEVMP